uniref:BEN domain-containing protein 2 n=1 Tax=Tursiops truncatus TaxID=9739 RepID=A0A6J3QTB1_TURTR|nr:BEN domain-containing protein 2 [Tursiops truncatus]
MMLQGKQGDCSPSLPVERQEDNAETNPVGTSLQSAALPELQQPVLRESPPPPRIVSTYSLEPCFTPRSPSPGLPVLSSYVSEGAESTNSVISSAQATVAVPIAVLPQGEPSLADTSETMNYSTIMGNNSMGPDAALTFLCMPPITEVSGKAETSLGNSTESRYYPTFLGNDSGRDTASSSIFIPPNFGEFEMIHITTMPEIAETSLENNPETMSYPTLLGNDSGQYSSLPVNLPPNFAEFQIMHTTIVGKYILVEVPGTAETSLENSSQTVYCPASLGNISGPDTDSSSHYLLPSFALENAILTEMPAKAETSMENSSQTVYYPNLVGNDSGPDAASSTLSIPPNFENSVTTESSLEDKPQMKKPAFLEESGPEMRCEIMNYPMVQESDSDEDTDSENSFLTASSEKSVTTESSLEDKPQMKYPAFLEESGSEMRCETINYPMVQESDSDEDTDSENSFLTASSENSVTPESSLEDKPQMKYPAFLEESGPEMRCEIMNYPMVQESDSDEDTDSENSFLTASFEILAEAVSSLEDNTQMKYPAFLEESGSEMRCEIMNYPMVQESDSDEDTDSENSFLTASFEKSPETTTYPLLLEKNSSQDISSLCRCIPPSFGYLGDPRRNVRMLDIHLMTAQKEATPKHAARYLVRILFSKEIMISSSVAVNSQGRQPLDPNKMAAIREHLAAIFPNHDLRECGKDWQACISDINSLICHLCSKRTPQKTVNNIEPTNPDTDSNDKRDGDDSESSSLLSQQAAGSETRENGNSQQNSSPEGIKEPSTDNSTVSYETLEYLGNPCRNIQMPKSVLNIAKEKSLPELSARYLICNLFTEEVLIKSNVYGSLGRGTCALNANKINALREFLQDIYPTCDLSETGYDWKFCVTAINSCICSLRYDHKKSTSKSQPLPETTPSTESEPRDTGLAD